MALGVLLWLYSGTAVWTLRGMAVWTLRSNSTFKQLYTSFPHGTLEPRDIGTASCAQGHWNLGTLEPQVSAQGGERAPTREPAKGTDPRNGLKLFRYPLGSRRRSLRGAFHCQVAHGGYDVLGRCMLFAGKVSGLSFPETLRGGAVPQHQSELMGREGATWSDAPFVKLHCRTT